MLGRFGKKPYGLIIIAVIMFYNAQVIVIVRRSGRVAGWRKEGIASFHIAGGAHAYITLLRVLVNNRLKAGTSRFVLFIVQMFDTAFEQFYSRTVSNDLLQGFS